MLTITRIGPDPRLAVPELIRSGVGQEVSAQQTRLTDAAVKAGNLDPDHLTRRIIVGSTIRQVHGDWRGINQWPLVPYQTITTGDGAQPDLIAEAMNFVIASFNAKAPRGNRVKSHPWRYAKSLRIYRDGRQIAAVPPVEQIAAEDVFQIINAAPHSPVLEADRHILAGIAREAIAKFPTISIQFGWLNSDQIGLRYGQAQGGTSGQPAIYALPVVTVAGSGGSRIATAARKSRKRTRRRRA